MSLSTRIVQRGIATVREVEEALARQVLYGGDLVTNLLEVTRIDEGRLMPIVAEELGLPNAPIGELPRATREAQRMVAPEVALERAMAPLTMDSEALVVAVAEPLPADDEQELAFALAIPILQQIAPLVRIRQALQRDYGVPLDRRLERLLEKMKDNGPGTKSSFPPARMAVPAPKDPPRPPSNQPRPKPARSPEPPPVRPSGTPPTLLRSMEAPPARPPRRRRGPLTMEVAEKELEAASERDTIFDLLFEYSRQYFDYTALFLVKDDVAEGRDASGEGAPRDLVARVGVPLDLPSLLGKARNEKKLVRGKGDPSGVDGVLAKDLARKGNTEWVVLPVVVRKRVVALLLGDGGEGGIDDAGLEEVTAVATQAVSAFERVIVRRKLKGSAPPGADDNPSPHTQIPKTQLSAEARRPSVEELAAPIRDLVNETERPASDLEQTARQPPALPLSAKPSERPIANRSSAPPAANVVAVRKLSGAPIPREEPMSLEMRAVDLPVAKNSSRPPPAASRPAPPPPSPLVPPPPPPPPVPTAVSSPPSSANSPMPRSKPSGTLRRAVAPPLEFGSQPPPPVVSPMFAESDRERRLVAEIQGTPAPPTIRDALPPAVTEPPPPEPAPFTAAPTSPKAASPPPPKSSSITDPSPLSPFIPGPPRTLEIIGDESATPMPVDLRGDDATPAAPSVAEAPVSPVRVTSKLQVSLPSVPKPMPPSEQQISVAPHRPPSSRRDSERGLPSVIVDTTSEYVAHVNKVLEGDDEEAENQLIRAGGAAMPAIMERFPGPIAVEPLTLDATLPRVAECGPILRLVASQRRTAVPYVLALVDSDDADKRFWATYLITELVYPDAIDAVVRRVFDEDARVRRVARLAARALAESHPSAVVDRLSPTVQDKIGKKDHRMLAIDTLGETREPLAVLALVPVLSDKSSEIGAAARAALTTITRQDFGTDSKKWEAWWQQHEDHHRLEWMMDALTHDQASIRAAASEELKAITKEFFGYHSDLPKREREKAQARYREWWKEVGRVRFNRGASSRGG